MEATEIHFSDAAAMLDACRNELDRCGFRTQAEALKGLEIFDAADAEVALFTLRGLPKAGGFAEAMKGYAAQALVRAMEQGVEQRLAG
jgi:hypothetical protein